LRRGTEPHYFITKIAGIVQLIARADPALRRVMPRLYMQV